MPYSTITIGINFESHGVHGMINNEKREPLPVTIPCIDSPLATVLHNNTTASKILATSSETIMTGAHICKYIGCSVYGINFFQCITKKFQLITLYWMII